MATVEYRPLSEAGPLTPLREVLVDESRPSKIAIEIFNQFYNEFAENIAFKDKAWCYSFILPGVGFAGGAITMFAGVENLGAIIGGGITTVSSALLGVVLHVSRNHFMSPGLAIVAKGEELKSFYNAFTYFKLKPSDHSVHPLFRLFEKLVERDVHNNKFLTKVELYESILFGPSGKVLLMDAIAEILLKKNSSSPLVETWQQAKEKNTASEYGKFWRELDIEAPSQNAYHDANQYRESFQLDGESLQLENFHDILKDKLESALQMALDAKLL